MKNILVIDTSSAYLKIALNIQGKKVLKKLDKGFTHIENLIPEIDNSFKKIKKDKTLIEYIGVCTGPGSFTGLRIGIATVLGISYAGGIKCFGFSVFDIYKYLFESKNNTVIIPVIDAKKNRFYCSFIESNREYDMLDISANDIVNEANKYNNKQLIFTGKDFDLIKNIIKNKLKYKLKYKNDYNPEDMLNFANWYIENNKELKLPVPIYLRKSEAEIALMNKKHK